MKIVFLGNFSVSYSSETHHAKSLEALGHEVIRFQEGKASGEDILKSSINSDLFIVVHTHGWTTPVIPLETILERLKGNVITCSYHLDLWLGIEREKDLERDKFYSLLDYFFCTDQKMVDWFYSRGVQGYYLPAGVFHEECYLLDLPRTKDIIFVGSRGYHHEWKWRPQLIDWLKESYPTFEHYGNDGIKVVRGHELNKLYASTKIAVGDTLCLNFNNPHYFSDRLFESTGRGAFTIFPYITGIEDYFKLDQELVTYQYGDFEGLRKKINYYLTHHVEREKIRQAGFERTKKHYTYLHRWQKILEVIDANTWS